MKRLRLIVAILGLAIGLGATSSLSNVNAKNSSPVKADTDANYEFYLNIENAPKKWQEAAESNKLMLQTWDGQNGSGHNFDFNATHVENLKTKYLYKYSFPKNNLSTGGFCFYVESRQSSDGSGKERESVWTSASNIAGRYFCINSKNTSCEQTFDSYYVYNNPTNIAETKPTFSTQRIWFCIDSDSLHYEKDGKTYYLYNEDTVCVHAWNKKSHGITIVPKSVINDDDNAKRTVFYADVPLDTDGFIVANMTNDFMGIKYESINIASKYASNKFDNSHINYVYEAWNNGSKYKDASHTEAYKAFPSDWSEQKDTKIGPKLVATALEGYVTCSPSEINGYKAFNRFKNSFYQFNGNQSKIDVFNAVKLNDYVLGDFKDGVYNDNAAKTENATTAGSKFAEMETLYTKSLTPGSNVVTAVKNHKTTIIASCSGVGAFAILGCFGLFLKKRKFN